jgi:ATP-dependent RNA helicase RhlE
VEQRFRFVAEDAKPREFMRLIRDEKGTIIVFMRSKDGATRLWRWLHSHGVYDATFIHSDRTQADRELALKEFKEGKYRILIATDVAARGIHVDNVAHVINYDLPIEAEDYIHRIGRTGRQGATGVSTTLITPKDRRQLAAIEKLLGRAIKASDATRKVEAPSKAAGSTPQSTSQEGAPRRKRRGRRGGSAEGRSDGRTHEQKSHASARGAGVASPIKPLSKPRNEGPVSE